MSALQLFVQGVGLVLGNGVTVIAVQAASTLSLHDALVAIGAAIVLFGTCMALVGRIVTMDSRPGAVNRLLTAAFGEYAGFARLAQQLNMIAVAPSIARSAFALYFTEQHHQQHAAVAFVVLCVALKLWWTRALDAFNAATGVLEMARWVMLILVLAAVVAVGHRHGHSQAMHALPHGAPADGNVRGMAVLAMTALYGLAGMEALVEKGGKTISARALMWTMAAVLAASSAVYVLVPALTMALVPLHEVQHLQATGNTAALNDALLRLCLAPWHLSPHATWAFEALLETLVFVSLINGASTLTDLNYECLQNIGRHSLTRSVLRFLCSRYVAAACVCGAAAVCGFSDTAAGLVGAVSALVLISHLVTCIAFWAVCGGTHPKWVAAHVVAVALLLTGLVATASTAHEQSRILGLIGAALVLPLWAVWNTDTANRAAFKAE